MVDVKCILDSKAQLGEGVYWNANERRVYWVDIEGCALHRFDPESGANESIDLGQPVGTVAEGENGKQLVGLKDGVYEIDFDSGERVKLCDPMEGNPDNRLNDGKAGPDGRFYVGSIGSDKEQFLYRIENDKPGYSVIESGVTISNGLVWSLDNRTLFYIDSPERQVVAYDFDMAKGEISNKRVAIDATGVEGIPDGMTIDCEGMLWVAFWEGWRVRRYDPSTGNALQEIKLPVARVTSCAFGGDDLDRLFITTASLGFTEDDWRNEPQAGGLFVCDPGVKGISSFVFGERSACR